MVLGHLRHRFAIGLAGALEEGEAGRDIAGIDDRLELLGVECHGHRTFLSNRIGRGVGLGHVNPSQVISSGLSRI